MSFYFIDFEFNNSKNPVMGLVACNIQRGARTPERYWLHNNKKEQNRLRDRLLSIDRNHCLVAFNAVAEARCFIQLGLRPENFNWIDLYLEYRMLLNHNHTYAYGMQLVEGKPKMTFPPKPKWERTRNEQPGFKPKYSLAEACYKLLGKIVDTEHKNKIRDIIISANSENIEKNRKAIEDYCESDVILLPPLWAEFQDLRESGKISIRERLLRGKYAALTAKMEQRGYPINVENTRAFSKRIPFIIYECQAEINKLFPQIKPFKFNHKTGKFTWNQLATRVWIMKNAPDIDRWERTDTGQISLSLDAFQQFYDFKHDYPKDNFGAQMVRFLKLKQAMNGFSETGERSFWDYVGDDGRVRPYMNIYGAQSSRSQPAATGFLFLKPAWMRCLVEPKPGKAIVGIDYGSQEFFVAGILSGDKVMMDAYLSGDPYLAFAKAAKAVPPDATKESHKRERDLAKSTLLGISYLMSKYGLAIKLSQDTGEVWDEDRAQAQIDLFYETFSDLKEFQDELVESYSEGEIIKLPCGWTIYGDNPNHRSVNNVPIQGFGASVMRKAVELAERKGLEVIFTLHDAIYVECNSQDVMAVESVLRKAMVDAFVIYSPDKFKDVAAQIRLDPYAWGPDLPDGEINGAGKYKITTMPLYIDERAVKEYEKFKHHFDANKTDGLF